MIDNYILLKYDLLVSKIHAELAWNVLIKPHLMSILCMIVNEYTFNKFVR